MFQKGRLPRLNGQSPLRIRIHHLNPKRWIILAPDEVRIPCQWNPWAQKALEQHTGVRNAQEDEHWPQWHFVCWQYSSSNEPSDSRHWSHEFISVCVIIWTFFFLKVSSSKRSIIWGCEQRGENITSKCLHHEFIVFPQLMLWEHWGNQCCILLRRKGCIFFFRGGVSSLFDKESLVDVSELCEEQFIKNQKSSPSQKEDCSKQTPLEWQNCYEHITPKP